MKITYHKKFLKHYQKRILPYRPLDQRYTERVLLFLENQKSPILEDHLLVGDLAGYRAFSITGDIRIIYFQKEDVILFIDIGTHNQVY